jgi:hypothetical protein
MVSWSSGILNKLVAPGIVEFTVAEIPDITDQFPEAQHWLANHFLNSVLRASFKDGYRQVAVGFLRRAYHGFGAFHSAREQTLQYLVGNDPHNPRLTKYYDAVASWETFALQVSMALDLFRWLNGGEGAFIKNDGSPEQRIYTIANQVKHLSSCVEAGQCSEFDSVPLWLSNDGIHSFGVAVTYEDAATVLADIATFADQLQDPKTFTRQDAGELA